MKKRRNKLFCLVLSVAMLLIASSSFAEGGTSDGITFEVSSEALTEEVLQAIPASRIVDYQLYEQANKAAANLATQKAGEDTFGGIYYDNGEFVFLFKALSQGTAVDSQMQELSSKPGFRIEQCKYSLAELDATWQAIQDTIVQDLTGYIGVGIDTSDNAVLLHYVDEDINNIKAQCAKAGIDIDMMKLEKLPAPLAPTASIKVGGTSYNSTRSVTTSACVGVSGPAGNGFIVQGHDTKVGDTIKTGSGGSTMGSVNARCQPMSSGYEADASYVKLNSGNSFNNTVPNLASPNTVVAGQTFGVYDTLPVHMTARHATASSPWNSGYVTAQNYTYSWDDRDGRTHNYIGALADYTSIAGDSGGFVFVYTNLGPIWAGVQSGGGAGVPYSSFARATDVAASMGVSVN